MFTRIGWVLLLAPYHRRFVAILFASVMTGASAAGALASINYALSGGSVLTAAVLFTLAAGGKVVGQFAAQAALNRLCQDSLFKLRQGLARMTTEVSLDRLEQIPPHQVCSALTVDIATVADALNTLPTLVVNVALLLACTVYLGWLSPILLAALTAVVVPGIVGYLVLRKSAIKSWRAARAEYERLVQLAIALVEGGKELRLYRGQRDHFLEVDLDGCLASNREHNLRTQNGFILLDTWTQSLLYLLIGVIVFVTPGSMEIPTEVMISSVLVIFFLMRPLLATISALPVLSRGGVALVGLDSLRGRLSNDQDESASRETPPPSGVVQLVNAHFSYAGKRDGFRLGPVELTLVPGEVVIVVGENGSGKSTLAKIVAGLYPLTLGEVKLGGQRIDASTRDAYRQLLAAVFTGSYIFDRLPGEASPERDSRAVRLLNEFQLAHRVRIEGDRLIATGLSHGERQRLALFQAYLEDRPFYVFDEWAAHQDPEFKHSFYTKLLPELRQRGKGVLVISHDDRYFASADRLIRLDDGVIRGDEAAE